MLAAFLMSYQAPPPYTGDIREDDPRVRQILAEMRNAPDENPPEEWKLRYGGPRGDYLAFYDLEGRDVYFRYREDRFDRRSEKKRQELIAGQGYRVRGRFQGVLVDGVFFAADSGNYPDALREPEALLAYEYVSVFPLRIEQILY